VTIFQVADEPFDSMGTVHTAGTDLEVRRYTAKGAYRKLVFNRDGTRPPPALRSFNDSRLTGKDAPDEFGFKAAILMRNTISFGLFVKRLSGRRQPLQRINTVKTGN
jgi:hypothetical protein